MAMACFAPVLVAKNARARSSMRALVAAATPCPATSTKPVCRHDTSNSLAISSAAADGPEPRPNGERSTTASDPLMSAAYGDAGRCTSQARGSGERLDGCTVGQVVAVDTRATSHDETAIGQRHQEADVVLVALRAVPGRSMVLGHHLTVARDRRSALVIWAWHASHVSAIAPTIRSGCARLPPRCRVARRWRDIPRDPWTAAASPTRPSPGPGTSGGRDRASARPRGSCVA